MQSQKIEGVHSPLIELMHSHRSIRRFKPDPVADELVEAMVAAGQCAPSSCFRQMYSVIAVRDPNTKGILSELCGKQSWVADCPVFLAFCIDQARLDDICQQHDKQINLEHTETFLMAAMDVALVMQNAALAAEALGLGVVMIGGLRNHPREIIRLLELPRGVFPISGMCVGYPDETPQPRPRLPLGEVLHWEHYQAEGRAQRLEAYDTAILEAEIYRRKSGALDKWTDVMARTTSRPPAEEGRHQLIEILREQGFEMK